MPLTFTDLRDLSAHELNRMAASIAGTHVFPGDAGGAATSNSNMSPSIAAILAGYVTVNDVLDMTGYAGGLATIGAADATNPRRDIIWYDGAGAIGVTAGTAAVAPVLPTLTAGRIAIYEVYVAAGDTSIDAGDLVDRRAGVGPWHEIVKDADETVNNSNTLQNDDDFFLTAVANMDYLVEMDLLVNGGATPDWHFSWLLVGMTWGAQWVSPAGGVATGITTTTASGATSGNLAQGGAPFLITIRSIIHAGSTGGTLRFQWAQNVADVSDTKVLKNSSMRWRRLGAT